jgi:anti-sigma factor RsiW
MAGVTSPDLVHQRNTIAKNIKRFFDEKVAARRLRMNCREFTEFLGEYLSGNLHADVLVEFENHLAECPSCVAYLDSYQKTVALEKAAFAASADAPLPAQVPEELVQAILRARARSS